MKIDERKFNELMNGEKYKEIIESFFPDGEYAEDYLPYEIFNTIKKRLFPLEISSVIEHFLTTSLKLIEKYDLIKKEEI